MYRRYLQDLINWVGKSNRKPLIVWGARQVGKTYLIKELFAKQYFPGKFIYVDCREEHEFVDYCLDHVNAKEILRYLSLDRDTVIDKNTLLIFDEVQECLPIVALMKYFCQDFKEIPIIVTGSMVRIKIQREDRKRGAGPKNAFLFPVGKINQLTVYPMDFEEFLMNRNKQVYSSIRQSYDESKKCDDLTHRKALEAFYEYMLVGGMPEVVDTFLRTEGYQEARETLKDLYDNYLSDMDLYQASPESIVRTKKVFENIYTQLNKESKNFKASLIEKNAKGRDLRSPIDWLSSSFLVSKSSLVKEKITIPLIDSNESVYRLYLTDNGIFSYQSRIKPTTFIDKNCQNSLSGIFFENYVASELVRGGYRLFYWKGKGDSEFEFVVEYDSKIIPVDVKKSKGTLNSLEKFKDRNGLYVAIKISEENFSYNGSTKILTVPFYYVPFLVRTLQSGELDKLLEPFLA